MTTFRFPCIIAPAGSGINSACRAGRGVHGRTEAGTRLGQLLAMIFTLANLDATALAAERPDLTGRVTRTDGSPVTNATVFIYTAGPKIGTGVLCPSCYPDCTKRARTDRDGAFRLDDLDPALRFRLLVVAPGHASLYVPKTDPLEGPRSITMALLPEAKANAPSRIRGVVLDAAGKAVPGVTISPEGVARAQSTQWGGTDMFVDPLAVTDEQGRFWLYCTNGVDIVHAVAEGRGLAKKWVELKPGEDHLLRLDPGVLVSGRIMRDDRALPGVVLGVVTKDRSCGNFLRGDEMATDRDGNFAIPDVPPEREFVLYARMDSLQGRGVVPSRTFKTGASGSVIKLGTIAAQAGHEIAGQLELSDGQPVPAGTRLLLGRDDAWDHSEVQLDASGRFAFLDVPKGSVSLNVRIKGYKFSRRNPSLDRMNGSIDGRVSGNVTGLRLLLEPGDWQPELDASGVPAAEPQPRDQPLRGFSP